MKISRTTSGRVIVILSGEERRTFRGPYQLAVSHDQKQVALIQNEAGHKGGAHHGDEWKIDFNNDQTRRMGAFGAVSVKAALGEGKLIAQLPNDLPPAIARKKPKKVPVVVNNTITQTVTGPGLPDLIRQINAAREACPDNMVFSTDADGYLRVTVEYGRG